jgi:ATP-binding cassette, subfamily B, bacterial
MNLAAPCCDARSRSDAASALDPPEARAADGRPGSHARSHPAHTSTLRWTLRLMRPYARQVTALGALSFAEVGLRALSPWPLKAVIDFVVGHDPLPVWLRPLLLPVSADTQVRALAAILLFGLLTQLAHQAVLMVHTRLHTRIGQGMVYALRATVFSHLQSLSLAHHDRTPRGDTVYRLEADATCIEQLLLKGLFPVAFSTVTLLVMFSVLASFDATLALVAMSIAPLLYLTMRMQAERMSSGARHTRELESRLVERLYESFSTIRLVKGFAREPHELRRFSGAANEAMEARVRLAARESFYGFLINAVTVAGGLAVMGVGAMHVLDGTIRPGTLLVVMAYLGYVYGPMTAIATTGGSIQQALAGARRVRQTLSLPGERDGTQELDRGRMRGLITFDHVSFGYDAPGSTVRDVTFSVAPGEMVAIVGPSGAGKTTLVSMLTRFIEPDSGRVLIDGVDASTYRLQSLREQVGVVLQEGLLFAGTMADNIRYGRLDATDAEVSAAAEASAAADFIAHLSKGYNSEMAEAGAGLSGGERQRLGIARAFLKGAPILILDEPTASLDALSEARVLDAVRRLRAGRTTLVIAHRLSTVREADRIIVMDHGQVVGQGTHATLVETCELYADMCAQLQFGQVA